MSPATQTEAQVRAVMPTDLDEIVQLCAEHAAYERAPFTHDGQQQRLHEALCGRPPRLAMWVVESRGLQGFAAASVEFSTWQARCFLHLDCLFLRPRWRRQGWGARLLEEVASYGRRQGCREIQWQTPPWNAQAIAFYERQGAQGRAKVRFTKPIDSTG